MKDEPLLELENISVRYGGVHALEGVSVSVALGEIVALMGPNGAGKSTVLKAIFGAAPVAHGKILWQGEEIRLAPHELAAMGISFVPQGRRVFPGMSVEENLEVGGVAVKEKHDLPRRIREAIDFFPVLKEKRRKSAWTLSGGEQQMLAIARGLITEPRLLLLDEPSLGLSPKFVKEIFAKIQEINERLGTTIIIVEHNVKSILALVTRAYIFDKGRVAAEGEPHALIESGTLEKVFLGKI